ncbi:MAG: class I SAM-dependent methyltransferase [Planctomycetota bacterium]
MSFTSPADRQLHDQLSTREGYDKWSSIYDGEDNPLIALETPEVRRLLGDVRGLRIADVGCGTGRHAIEFARAGAVVTAMDFSEGMLAKAREKAVDLTIDWRVHDLNTPLPVGDHQFDAVTCCLVLEHIQDLTPLFSEMGRICKPNGWIVISAMHPAMMLKGISARFTDPTTGRETRPESHDNQISDFVLGAVRAGLRIDQLGEHRVDEALAARSPRSQKYLHWPMLLTMRLRPPGGP